MKKYTFLSVVACITGLIAFSFKASAQITITQADLPSTGLTVTTDSAGSPGIPPGHAQATAQAWDFSALTNQKAHTIKFMAPSSTPYSSVAAFSAANLADSTLGGNGYNFLTAGSSSFAGEGAEQIQTVSGNSFQIEIGLSPLFTESNLPATYNSAVAPGVAKGSETFSKSLDGGLITQERFAITIDYSDTVDAFGTLKMPGGKTYPVLRQIHHEVDYDSAYIYGPITSNTWTLAQSVKQYKNEYNWYTTGAGYILAEMDMGTTFDTAAHDIIWDASVPIGAGVSELSIKNNVSVYPNPANTQITFNTLNASGNADQYISVYDITGRQMEKLVVKNGVSILTTSAYSNGLYLYNLTDNSGNLLDRGKFIVQH